MAVNHFGPYSTSDYNTWKTALAAFTTFYGPYHITNYTGWRNALSAGLTSGNSLEVIEQNDQVCFLEVTDGSDLTAVYHKDQILFVQNT